MYYVPIVSGFPNTILSRKSKSTRNPVAASDSFVVLPYFLGPTDKLKRCLNTHSIRTAVKPTRTIGDILQVHKDTVSPSK